jgi:di/tricarboxylate transporter
MGPAEALSGFSSPATVTVLAMFILSEGVRRTGVVRLIGRKLRQFTGPSELRQLVATLGISGPLAGIVNNTPVVAVLIPTLVDLAKSNRISPSKLLIPLSYGSMMGGMLTLIGTASTILASDLSAQLIGHPFGMFEFTGLGAIVLVVGSAYLLTIGRRLIPERVRPEQDLTETFRMRAYLAWVRVGPESPLVGQTIEKGLRAAELDMDILQIVRGEAAYIGPFTDQAIREGDVLTIRADADTRDVFIEQMGVEALPSARLSDDTFIDANHTLLECTIPSESRLVGETMISSAFRNRYGATVLAIRRGDEVERDAVETKRLREGDSLLLQTTRDQEEVLHTVKDLVVTRATPAIRQRSKAEPGTNRRAKMPVALGIMAAVIIVAALGWYPIVITALAGVVGMVVTGCVKTDEAYAAVGWNVIFLMAGVIPLGIAMQKTGAAAYLAGLVIGSAEVLPAVAILGLFYLLTAGLANVIGNNASVIIMIPIAVDAAMRVEANPFAFVLAVTFAASTAFMTPVGYQTNLMVYTPGGYRFADFVRVGGPLQVLLAVVTTLGIAAIWGV